MGQNGTKWDRKTFLRPLPRQKSALHVIAAAPSVSEAARQANIGRSTLNRWLEDSEFRDELTRSRNEAAELARVELQGIMLEAVLGLSDCLQDPDPYLRIRAIRTALAFGVQLNEVKKLREDVEALDLALPVWAKHYSNL